MPKEILDYMEADYGIWGQSETSFPALVDSIQGNQIDKNIPGLVWKTDNGNIEINPPDLSGFKNKKPDWTLLSQKEYKKKLFPGLYPASVLTKSGCQFNYSFCNSRHISGNRFQFKTVKDIIYDIKHNKWY